MAAAADRNHVNTSCGDTVKCRLDAGKSPIFRSQSPCTDISVRNRDLARNEEFSEIAVINIFFTVLKTKTQLSVGGGVLRGKFRDKSRN